MRMSGFIGLVLSIIASMALADDASKTKGRVLAKTWCNSCHVIEKGDTSFDDGEIAPPFFDMKSVTKLSLTALLGTGHGDTPALSQLKEPEVRQLADWIKAQN